MVALIPKVNDELATHYFKIQFHTEQAKFFEFLGRRKSMSMAAMIENIEQFKKMENNTSYRK